MFGTTEIIVIVAVIVLIFGASAIPKLAKSLGQAKSEFEKGIADGKNAGAETSQKEDKKIDDSK